MAVAMVFLYLSQIKNMDEESPLITRDWLAIERTKLANERTFLAYFRTFIVFLGTGITILKLEFFLEMKSFGIMLLALSPIILLIGLIRLFSVKRTIKKHYKTP
jgi:putative membrane protein